MMHTFSLNLALGLQDASKMPLRRDDTPLLPHWILLILQQHNIPQQIQTTPTHPQATHHTPSHPQHPQTNTTNTHTHCTPLGSGAEMCSLLEEYPQLRRESDAKSPPPTRSAHPLWSSQLLASVAPERFHSHLQFHPAGRDMLPTHGIHTTTPRIRRREDVSHPLPAGRDVLST